MLLFYKVVSAIASSSVNAVLNINTWLNDDLSLMMSLFAEFIFTLFSVKSFVAIDALTASVPFKNAL